MNEVRRQERHPLHRRTAHAGGRRRAEGAIDASNVLKPALARGEIQCIGATTFDEYRKYIEKDAALSRRFQPITVDQPTPEQTVEILKGLRDKYEAHHRVSITDDAAEGRRRTLGPVHHRSRAAGQVDRRDRRGGPRPPALHEQAAGPLRPPRSRSSAVHREGRVGEERRLRARCRTARQGRATAQQKEEMQRSGARSAPARSTARSMKRSSPRSSPR